MPISSVEQYVVDSHGHKVGVVLSIEAYEALVDALEELEDIRAYDEAAADARDLVPFEQATVEIESAR